MKNSRQPICDECKGAYLCMGYKRTNSSVIPPSIKFRIPTETAFQKQESNIIELSSHAFTGHMGCNRLNVRH